MGKIRKTRRQPHGSAWHWKQTDCWYFTLPGTKKRMPPFDEHGHRIRGRKNKSTADMALELERVACDGDFAAAQLDANQWLVAQVCSEYLQFCERGFSNGRISKNHRDNAFNFLNDLCSYCGDLRVDELKKTHVQT